MTGPTAESDLLPHRLRQAQEKEKADASFRSVANITGVTSITAAAIPTESTALKPPSTAPATYLHQARRRHRPSPLPRRSQPLSPLFLPVLHRSPLNLSCGPPKPFGRPSSPDQLGPKPDAPPPTSVLEPSVTPVLASPPARKARAPAGGGSTSAVIGPGDFSSPTDFELRSGCISGTL